MAEQVCFMDSRGAGQGIQHPEQNPAVAIFILSGKNRHGGLRKVVARLLDPTSDHLQAEIPLASDIKTNLGPPPLN